MTTRTTKADLQALLAGIEHESRTLGILAPGQSLTIRQGSAKEGIPYRLRIDTTHAFEPADGNHGDIGRSAREAEHTLRIMWYTLRAARKAVGR